MKQTFVRKPVEIVALRFRYNNREIEEFLKENNEDCGRDYEWRFCFLDATPLLEIRKPLSEPGEYSIIEIPRGDYITTDEDGTIIHMRQEDIEELYDEVKPDDNKTTFTTFKGDFSTITNIVKELNSKCGHDRYKCFCHESPCIFIEICDYDRATQFNLTKGDTLVIGNKDRALLKIPKEEYEYK
jgi:hypothetical protein|nr:MAG TPA: hypothetical protein [Caudoviricetes sp.]